MANVPNRPTSDALRVEAWRDLPGDKAPALYEITRDDGSTDQITLAKGNRIILVALIAQPVFCASPVRISDRICILRHEHGVPITKEMSDNDVNTDRARYGVCFLDIDVRRIEEAA